ncbi:Oligopeptide transport ATP-binding protein oppD [Oxalobacteraceae bacterium IMCC9480]|nr:Oligopeptide transport ATP-binding protein oppD [Oxalobacteraceae bacterium IMCC9480]NDP60458.1 ABC transporter ATP-binding protein [Oxalobacteraceae bacterium]
MKENTVVPTLSVSHLHTQFTTRAGIVKAVDDVSFSVMPGQIMGLVGESGSGKSMTGYSIMGLIDHPGKVTEGSILLQGRELRGIPADAMRKIRGDRIAMIFQDPMMTLNPVLRIDTQMMEAVLAHHDVSKDTARAMSRDALARVGIPSPDERLLAYPHQFSGGMRQRVAIAIALLNKPDLIICDEPTTALDVTIQGQILYEMQKLCRESGTALIWITHDLSVVAGLADTVCVMYAGKIVESGTVRQVLEQPRHPYTHGLIASAPSRNPRGQPLRQIPGMTPSLLNLPGGCAFRERCDRASAACAESPPLEHADGRALRCFHPIIELAEVTS